MSPAPRRGPRALRAWLPAVLLPVVLLASAAFAQEAPIGVPEPDKAVRDRDFGVQARHLGLERRVEMLQWRSTPQGYVRAWAEEPVDSRGFAPGHDNPPFPLQGRRWMAASITLDDKPLAPEVVARLGEWQEFRPSFSALPGNLAATFQPEGDGLGSAENPLDPQVGDLRIHWRELVLPPLQGRVVLERGAWRLAPVPATAPLPDARTAPDTPSPSRLPWLLGGSLVLLVALFALRRRRRQDPP